MTDGEHSAENGSIHPITALPQGGEQGECEKTERAGGMGDGEGRDVGTGTSSELYAEAFVDNTMS